MIFCSCVVDLKRIVPWWFLTLYKVFIKQVPNNMAHWQRLHILVTCRITFDHHVLNLDGITMKQTNAF